MFRIPGTLPSRLSEIEELVDYIEWECIKRNSILITDSIKPIMLINDEIDTGGIEDESDKLLNRVDDILVEIERREVASNLKYPFTVNKNGYRISVTSSNQHYWVYLYLLLSTRLNMRDDKVWSKIDGTKILEELSAIIGKNYFGDRAESKVFGTAVAGGFQKKINDICKCIGEGQEFTNRNKNATTPSAKDDKLDIVVWKSFKDDNRSKLIGFGQCKTGTSWDDASTIELQPSDFCAKWLRDSPIQTPVKMFFSSQYFPLDDYAKSKNAGIVFDRFRILDYVPEVLDHNLLGQIRLWCRSAIHGISNR